METVDDGEVCWLPVRHDPGAVTSIAFHVISFSLHWCISVSISGPRDKDSVGACGTHVGRCTGILRTWSVDWAAMDLKEACLF
jgi:hypothetical protein